MPWCINSFSRVYISSRCIYRYLFDIYGFFWLIKLDSELNSEILEKLVFLTRVQRQNWGGLAMVYIVSFTGQEIEAIKVSGKSYVFVVFRVSILCLVSVSCDKNLGDSSDIITNVYLAALYTSCSKRTSITSHVSWVFVCFRPCWWRLKIWSKVRSPVCMILKVWRRFFCIFLSGSKAQLFHPSI